MLEAVPSRRLFALVLGVLAPVVTLAAVAMADTEPTDDQVSSLREGNRLYREGRLEEARDRYLAGYTPETPHPILAYNLGTTSHHLGLVPEAILWYRRAQASNPGDPWMQQNLDNARAGLGLQPYPAPGLAGLVARQRTALLYAGASLAWCGLILWIARPRRSAALAFSLLAAGILTFGTTMAMNRNAPQAAVVLEDCSAASGDLPAGSEIWVTGRTEEGFRITAGEAVLECPSTAIALVSEAG